jgi:hypothetical protein
MLGPVVLAYQGIAPIDVMANICRNTMSVQVIQDGPAATERKNVVIAAKSTG